MIDIENIEYHQLEGLIHGFKYIKFMVIKGLRVGYPAIPSLKAISYKKIRGHASIDWGMPVSMV